MEFFAVRTQLRTDLQAVLRRCADIERISGRIAYGNAGPRDLVTLGETLFLLPQVKNILKAPGTDGCPVEIMEAVEAIRELSGTADLVRRAIVENPPALVRNGGVIREGYCEETRRAQVPLLLRERLDRGTAAGREGKNRYTVPEDRVYLGIRVLH